MIRTAMLLAPGTRLGPYEILTPIGAGGMGEVYKARDTRLNRIVAIKKGLAPFNERFEREAHAIASLNHPHICSLYDVGPDYLVMEYVEGRPLAGPVDLDEAFVLARQILDAVEAAQVMSQSGYCDQGGTTRFMRAYATDCPRCSLSWIKIRKKIPSAMASLPKN